MQQNFQDALAVCKEYGHPDLFITLTCNPKWDEIQEAVRSLGSQDAYVRPDIVVARVFKMKLDAMMDDFTKKNVLGRVLAVVYTLDCNCFGWNLTANAARPNPQGSYHYGTIPIVRTLVLANSAPIIKGKPRYAINKVSYKNPSTPLKLADYYNISGVYNLNTIKDTSPPGPAVIGTSVVGIELHDFVEIVFQNDENAIQSYHLDGSDFWVVGFGSGQWNSTMRKRYNLFDATTRYTAQVFPLSWTAILVSMDNKGMWNLRSAIWPRQYLGQQLYLRVWNDETSIYTESDIPPNALRCGKAANV
ncbi:Plastocyanin-like domain-containing protein [Heracleum sosnowskyi]|uniref:Plastocyanin-like domain-containing protein n=1 Tax=Heracleum sosnowskyi TaxID=360622 RepID=A0AAD8H9K7_9APIA|nr:Plastocyanin-like domain-containing protein [Heracleum sosnowskyi]